MQYINTFLPLIALVIGFFLSRINKVFDFRADRKRIAGRVLADLLSIRHLLKGLDFQRRNTEEISKRVGINKEQRLLLHNQMRSYFFELASISERYLENLSSLAEADPLLSFRLRSKNKATTIIKYFKNEVGNDISTFEIYKNMESKIILEFIEVIEEEIIEVASVHGFTTKRKINKYIQSPNDKAEERARRLQAKMIEMVEQQDSENST